MKRYNEHVYRVAVWRPGMCLPVCSYCDLWEDCEELTSQLGVLPCYDIQKNDYCTRYFKLVETIQHR